jgi:hypothetical protein
MARAAVQRRRCFARERPIDAAAKVNYVAISKRARLAADLLAHGLFPLFDLRRNVGGDFGRRSTKHGAARRNPPILTACFYAALNSPALR